MDRGKAFEILDKMPLCNACDETFPYTCHECGEAFLMAMEALREPQTVRWVVKCKDCIHGYKCKNAAGEEVVECTNHYVSLDSICRNPDWFCADGERKVQQ